MKEDKNLTPRLTRPRCSFRTEEYFHCYLNQMPKPLVHSSNILRTKKHWEFWLNYSDDLLVKPIEKSDILSHRLFFNTAFYKLVSTYFIVYVRVKQKLLLKKIKPYSTFDWLGFEWYLVLQYQRFCVFGAVCASL